MPPAKPKSKPRPRKPTAARLKKLLAPEMCYWDQGFQHVAGVDEVGRGPLAGPVVAAAVVLPPGCWIQGVGDSKAMTAAQREEVVGRILQSCVAWAVGAASPKVVDRINIRRATALAMQRAIDRLRIRPDHLLVDGLAVPELGLETHTPFVGGDGRVHCIGAASILAKVTRDRLMVRLAARYPAYGWDKNKGYGTPEHLRALDDHGPTPHHRQSFTPCQLDFADLFD
jgi:ribonuclease HII